MANAPAPRWDRKMQQRLARGEAAALGELYDRFASLVHSLAHRVLDDETATDHATREVFGHIWEHPDAYDPRNGPMRSWIADITQEIATGRLRTRHRAERTRPVGWRESPEQPDVAYGPDGARPGDDGPGPVDRPPPAGGPESAERREQLDAIEEKVRAASTAARADYIVTSMPSSLRAALELTYFQRHDYRQAARQLGVTEDEARRRLRLGLQLLSSAVSRPEPARPSGHGRTR